MSIKTTDYEQQEFAAWLRGFKITEVIGDDWQQVFYNIHTGSGIVVAMSCSEYSEYGKSDKTIMEFIWNGRLYIREWNRAWGGKTITRLAREMVEEIVTQ